MIRVYLGPGLSLLNNPPTDQTGGICRDSCLLCWNHIALTGAVPEIKRFNKTIFVLRAKDSSPLLLYPVYFKFRWRVLSQKPREDFLLVARVLLRVLSEECMSGNCIIMGVLKKIVFGGFESLLLLSFLHPPKRLSLN